MLYTYIATVRDGPTEKIFTANNLLQLSKDIGICYTTVNRVANKKKNCLTGKYITIDKIERESKKLKKPFE